MRLEHGRIDDAGDPLLAFGLPARDVSSSHYHSIGVGPAGRGRA